MFRFEGRIVCRLPFTPISFLQGLSHRNLTGDDYTECSFIFLYIICTMSIRQVFPLFSYFSLFSTSPHSECPETPWFRSVASGQQTTRIFLPEPAVVILQTINFISQYIFTFLQTIVLIFIGWRVTLGALSCRNVPPWVYTAVIWGHATRVWAAQFSFFRFRHKPATFLGINFHKICI